MHLLTGELRQGALAGVMVEAIAAAAQLPVAEVRRAAMYAPSLGVVARAALQQGSLALAQFQLRLFSPVAPMLAQTAADVEEALQQLQGKVAFEWKMDGARIQVHRRGDEVRIYTRNLNDVTAAIPDIAAAVRAFDEPGHVGAALATAGGALGGYLAFAGTRREEPTIDLRDEVASGATASATDAAVLERLP